MNPLRILVTGAAGFVGAALVRRLIADGHQLHVLIKPTTDVWRLADVGGHFRLHRMDLADRDGLDAVLAEARPQIVYHAAAHGGYPTQNDARRILESNVLGTWNLLEALTPIDYDVFVNVGSSSEYGFKSQPMRETDLLQPASYYAVAKCAQTLLCQHVARSLQRPIVTLRLFSVYGPFEEPTRLVPTLIRRCLDGEELILVDPTTARDFIYVDDVVEAALRVEQLASCGGEIINIGTGVQHTLRDVVALVLQHTGARVPCRWGAMPPRIWDTATWVAGPEKCERLLGWRARTTLADGLASTVAWQQARHGSNATTAAQKAQG
jgi:nucleoside-diphosphate-sugar epimerase